MIRQQSVVTVSKKALLHNLRIFQKYVKVPIAPVLKSNAYGHGICEVARLMDRTDVPFFVVNSVQEAHDIRACGVNKEIQIIGYTPADVMAAERLAGVAYTVSSMSQLQSLVQCARRTISVHIKIDTGMSRQGIAISDIEHVLTLLTTNKYINVIGVCSHLADADGKSQHFTKRQIAAWEHAVVRFKSRYPNMPWVHLTATTGSYYAKHCTQTVGRLGVGLYGFNVSHAKLALQPALELTSVLCNIKKVAKGSRIGYNGIHTAKKDMTIATIPLGYFEGVDRRLSNKGWVSVRGIMCPIIGRVSMNITTIDVSHVSRVREGERVIVISSKKTKPHSLQSVATTCNTIPYEILVHIMPHIARVYL